MLINKKRKLYINKHFVLFFLSQTVLGCGLCIQNIAFAQLLLEKTGSGLTTGFSMITAPLPGMIFSIFAGNLGERLPSKNVLIVLDILKGLAILFIIFSNTGLIMFIMLLVNFLDVLYTPSKNKILRSIIGKDELLNGNSILNGGYGLISLTTPMIMGFFISIYGPRPAFLINSLLCFLSSFLLSKIKIKSYDNQDTLSLSVKKYFFRLKGLKNTILTLAVIDFGTTSVNIAFYSFAFDTLKVSSSYWGLMLSILYGMNLFSMLLLMCFKKWFSRFSRGITYLMLAIVSCVWCYYCFSNNILYILVVVAIEGICLSLVNTLLTTDILENTKKEYIARVTGIRLLTSNCAKLLGICSSYVFMLFYRPRFVFVASAFIMLIYLMYRINYKE
ncbi:MAG: Major Facilitator Superfamily protein [Pelotomaculum sp. PtaB.Bin104]|nr:MAG: Major Facilitator Superfamily protein [Pelotomaculum sp. PtaB.Bin104]